MKESPHWATIKILNTDFKFRSEYLLTHMISSNLTAGTVMLSFDDRRNSTPYVS